MVGLIIDWGQQQYLCTNDVVANELKPFADVTNKSHKSFDILSVKGSERCQSCRLCLTYL